MLFDWKNCQGTTKSHATVLATCIFIILASATPVYPQIHWNRGWGAGGSVGKRSQLADGDTGFPEVLRAFSPECAGNVMRAAVSIANTVQREVEGLIECEVETRLTTKDGKDGLATMESSNKTPRDGFRTFESRIWGTEKKRIPDSN